MSRLSPWCVGLATLLLLSVISAWNYWPPVVGPQRFAVVFPAVLPLGTSEPLVVTGRPGEGDFLFVRYVGPNSVVFGYDSWGQGGLLSTPVTINPGARHALEVELPSFAAVFVNPTAPGERLRLLLDGAVVLDAKVSFRQRAPRDLFFARNPIGGSSCASEFHGQLSRADGRPLVGDVRAYFTDAERWLGWLRSGRWQLLANTLLAVAAALTARHVCTARSSLAPRPSPLARLQPHRAFALTATLCSVAFAAMLTNGTFHLVYRESFGNFYDYQALSLLQGRLDVPEESLSGEAFVYGGKIYGYFGVTPALLRLPFTIFGLGFGELSRVAMLLYYAATLVGAYLLLLDAHRRLRPDRPRPAAWQTILFTAHLGLGSTVFFLGSRAYIYHEAILCGVMFAVFSGWCALRHLANPAGRWWLGALLLGVLSVHARPPAGFFALTLLGCVAVATLLRDFSLSKLRRPVAIGALAVAGVASFNALSYAKFRTFEGCPLRLNVQYSANRLARIDNRQFHLANIPYGFAAYVLRPTIEFAPGFPWLYLGPKIPPQEFPAAKLDLPDRTAALPYGMTGLFVLATLGCAVACVQLPAARAPVFTLWAAAIPVSLAMFAAIATAERYTGDFVPFLIGAAAFGLAAPVWRPLTATALVAATLWCCALTFALTLHYQGVTVWGVPDEVRQNYERLRSRVDRFFLTPPPRP